MDVVDICFFGVQSCIQGVGFIDFENDVKLLLLDVWKVCKLIVQGGIFKYVYGGEYYVFNLDVIGVLYKVV